MSLELEQIQFNSQLLLQDSILQLQQNPNDQDVIKIHMALMAEFYQLPQLPIDEKGRLYAKIMQDYKDNADNGDPSAQYHLHRHYLRQGNHSHAAAFCSLAASKNPFAMNAMGKMYLQGCGVMADEDIAFNWFSRGASHQNLGAIYNQAICLIQGRGTQPKIIEGIEFLRKAAAGGHPCAIKLLEHYRQQLSARKGQHRSMSFTSQSTQDVKEKIKNLEAATVNKTGSKVTRLRVG